MSRWEPLGNVPPTELHESRLQSHWAAQLVAAVGSSLAPPKPDDSHTALTADTDRSLLMSASRSRRPCRVALSVAELRIMVLDDDLETTSAMALEGKTLRGCLEWITNELDVGALTFPDYEMPAHPIRDGAPFRRERPEAFDELSRWFMNAARILRELDLGAVRCWPHHFDLAVLDSLDGDKSVGVGLSPGDGSYDEPYWYVTPWPYPDASAELPKLPRGHWHPEGFTAAILTGSDVPADDQQEHVRTFLQAAIAGSRQLLA